MDKNSGGGQNQNDGFLKRYRITLALAAIVVIALAILAANRDENTNNQNEDQTNQQTENQNSNSDQSQNSDNQGSDNSSDETQSGNVTAAGTLKASDNTSRGNLMVESNRGKIYISTKRDFSSLLGKSVTLQAEGTISKFTFLGFAEGKGAVAGTDTTAMGGGDSAPSGKVSFSGELKNSDNTSLGNYKVVSNAGYVYLKSSRNYSSLVGSQVTLSATGTLQSFTDATITKN